MRQKITLFLFLLTPLLFTSCVSYKVMPKELRNVDAKVSPEKAYVINKEEFEKEYKILNDSKIFELSDDASTPLKIKLSQLTNDHGRPCSGQVQFFGMLLFVGQLPVHFDEGVNFSFEEVRNLTVTKREFDLKMRRRVWFWDMFLFNQNKKNKIAQGLRGYYYAQLKN